MLLYFYYFKIFFRISKKVCCNFAYHATPTFSHLIHLHYFIVCHLKNTYCPIKLEFFSIRCLYLNMHLWSLLNTLILPNVFSIFAFLCFILFMYLSLNYSLIDTSLQTSRFCSSSNKDKSLSIVNNISYFLFIYISN